MTKTIVLGTPTETGINKIELYQYLSTLGCWKHSVGTLYGECNFNYMELISLGYGTDFDLIFAYNSNNDRAAGVLYKGKWNDGIA